ncbi:MAG: hypothetical protein FWE27_03375 [Defluviitaleaceae bacterium]|nr:hypothetical protein [Defluviitaleaceae bacterium]
MKKIIKKVTAIVMSFVMVFAGLPVRAAYDYDIGYYSEPLSVYSETGGEDYEGYSVEEAFITYNECPDVVILSQTPVWAPTLTNVPEGANMADLNEHGGYGIIRNSGEANSHLTVVNNSIHFTPTRGTPQAESLNFAVGSPAGAFAPIAGATYRIEFNASVEGTPGAIRIGFNNAFISTDIPLTATPQPIVREWIQGEAVTGDSGRWRIEARSWVANASTLVISDLRIYLVSLPQVDCDCGDCQECNFDFTWAIGSNAASPGRNVRVERRNADNTANRDDRDQVLVLEIPGSEDFSEAVGATLDLNINPGSDRRVLIWTDVTGEHTVSFLNQEGNVPDNMLRSARFASGTHNPSITIPANMLYNGSTSATEIYLLYATDNEAVHVVDNRRGQDWTRFNEAKLTISLPLPEFGYQFKLQDHIATRPVGPLSPTANLGVTHTGTPAPVNLSIGEDAGTRFVLVDRTVTTDGATRGLLLQGITLKAGDIITVEGVQLTGGSGLNMRLQTQGAATNMPNINELYRAGGEGTGPFSIKYFVTQAFAEGATVGVRVLAHGANMPAQYRLTNLTVYRPDPDVAPASPTGLTALTSTNATIDIGESTTLAAIMSPANWSTPGYAVNWSGFNTDVATISGIGPTRILTGVADGTLTITAQLEIPGASEDTPGTPVGAPITFIVTVGDGGSSNQTALTVPNGREAVFHLSAMDLGTITTVGAIAGLQDAGNTASEFEILPSNAIRVKTAVTGYDADWQGIDVVPGEFGGLQVGYEIEMIVELVELLTTGENAGFRIEASTGANEAWAGTRVTPATGTPATTGLVVDQAFITANGIELRWNEATQERDPHPIDPPRFRVAGNWVDDAGAGGAEYIVHDILVHRPAGTAVTTPLVVPTGREAVFHLSALDLSEIDEIGEIDGLQAAGDGDAGGTFEILTSNAIRVTTATTEHAANWMGIDVVPDQFQGLEVGDEIEVIVELSQLIAPGVNGGFRIEASTGLEEAWPGTHVTPVAGTLAIMRITVDQAFITANNFEYRWEATSPPRVQHPTDPSRFRIAGFFVGTGGAGGAEFIVHDILIHREEGDVTTAEVTFTAGENGTISANVISGSISLPVIGLPINSGDELSVGTQVRFFAEPADGFQVASWSVGGTVVADYTELTLTREVLATGLTVAVTFTPTTGPTFSATLTPGTVTFDPLVEGYATGDIAPATLTIENTGTGQITGLSVAITGDDDDAFAITTPLAATSIAAQATTTFSVAPVTGLDEGTYTATVVVSSPDLDANLTATLSVTVASTPVPELSLSVTEPHTFAPVQLAQDGTYAAPTALSVVASNTGTAATGALTVSLSGTHETSFTLSVNSLEAIAPGTSAPAFTVVPRTTGLTAGTHNATVMVSGPTGSGLSASFNVSVLVSSFEAEPAATIDPTAHTFTSLTEGYAESDLTAREFTITNTGNVALTGLTITAGAYYVVTPLSGPIPVGEDGTFSVRPAVGLAAGNRGGTLTISLGETQLASATLNFTVAAPTAPSITTTGTTLPVGTQGQEYNFQLEGTGTTPLVWSATGLPTGLEISNDGLISGTPTESGSFNVPVTLTGATGTTPATRTFTLAITAIHTVTVGERIAATVNSVAIGATVPHGTTVLFTADPPAGQRVASWTVDGTTTPTNDLTITRTVNAPMEVTATFENIPEGYYQVTWNTAQISAAVGAASVQPGTQAGGTVVVFTPIVPPGNRIVSWSVGDTVVAGPTPTLTRTISTATAVTVAFEPIPTGQLTISNTEAKPSHEGVIITVRVDNNPGFATLPLKIGVPEGLTLMSYSAPTGLPLTLTGSDIPVGGLEGDAYVFMTWHGTANHTADGVILNLIFDVCDDAMPNDIYMITATFEDAAGPNPPLDLYGRVVGFTVTDGFVEIEDGIPKPPLGNVRGNGTLSVDDATLIARHLVGHDLTSVIAAHPDFNWERGRVTPGSVAAQRVRLIDATMIARFVAGHEGVVLGQYPIPQN